jgi:hypothetical protein
VEGEAWVSPETSNEVWLRSSPGGSMKPLVRWLALLLSGFGTIASAESKINPIKFSDTHLENGLRLIIAEDHYAPVYALAVSYAVRATPASHIYSST